MSQHDYVLDNASTLIVRLDFNDALDAAVTNNEGGAAPVDVFPGMFWFDSSIAPGGRMKRKAADAAPGDATWIDLTTADELVPKVGDVVISGDLYVAGDFTAPNFERLRASHEGASPPSAPVLGMLWFDTSGAQGVLKIYDDTGNWTTAAVQVSPVFTVNMTINNPSAPAELNTLSQGERRRMLSDAAGNRMSFFGPNDGLMGYITDTGDFVSALNGSLQAALAGKQNNLGFTPVRQAAGSPNIGLYWAGTPAGLHYQISQAYAGQIHTSASYVYPFAALPRGAVGTVSFLYRANDAMWPGNTTQAGSALEYGWDDGHGSVKAAAGTWRNVGGDAEYKPPIGFASGACTVAQRIA